MENQIATQNPEYQYKEAYQASTGPNLALKILLFVIFGVILGASGTYLVLSQQNSTPKSSFTIPPSATPTPDPTANWKTYENKWHGFSIKYPADWEEIKPVGMDPFFAKVQSPVVAQDSTKQIRYSLTMISGSPGTAKTIEEDNDRQLKFFQEKDPTFTLKERKKLKLDGIDAEWTVGYPASDGSIEVTFINDFILYQFIFQPYDQSKTNWETERYKGIFEQILSSFKQIPIDRTVGLGEACEGRSRNTCARGLICQLRQGQIADAGGTCVKEGSPSVLCTQDAKLCPDGSSVGRIAPNCKFAPCP